MSKQFHCFIIIKRLEKTFLCCFTQRRKNMDKKRKLLKQNYSIKKKLVIQENEKNEQFFNQLKETKTSYHKQKHINNLKEIRIVLYDIAFSDKIPDHQKYLLVKKCSRSKEEAKNDCSFVPNHTPLSTTDSIDTSIISIPKNLKSLKNINRNNSIDSTGKEKCKVQLKNTLPKINVSTDLQNANTKSNSTLQKKGRRKHISAKSSTFISELQTDFIISNASTEFNIRNAQHSINSSQKRKGCNKKFKIAENVCLDNCIDKNVAMNKALKFDDDLIIISGIDKRKNDKFLTNNRHKNKRFFNNYVSTVEVRKNYSCKKELSNKNICFNNTPQIFNVLSITSNKESVFVSYSPDRPKIVKFNKKGKDAHKNIECEITNEFNVGCKLPKIIQDSILIDESRQILSLGNNTNVTINSSENNGNEMLSNCQKTNDKNARTIFISEQQSMEIFVNKGGNLEKSMKSNRSHTVLNTKYVLNYKIFGNINVLEIENDASKLNVSTNEIHNPIILDFRTLTFELQPDIYKTNLFNRFYDIFTDNNENIGCSMMNIEKGNNICTLNKNEKYYSTMEHNTIQDKESLNDVKDKKFNVINTHKLTNEMVNFEDNQLASLSKRKSVDDTHLSNTTSKRIKLDRNYERRKITCSNVSTDSAVIKSKTADQHKLKSSGESNNIRTSHKIENKSMSGEKSSNDMLMMKLNNNKETLGQFKVKVITGQNHAQEKLHLVQNDYKNNTDNKTIIKNDTVKSDTQGDFYMKNRNEFCSNDTSDDGISLYAESFTSNFCSHEEVTSIYEEESKSKCSSASFTTFSNVLNMKQSEHKFNEEIDSVIRSNTSHENKIEANTTYVSNDSVKTNNKQNYKSNKTLNYINKSIDAKKNTKRKKSKQKRMQNRPFFKGYCNNSLRIGICNVKHCKFDHKVQKLINYICCTNIFKILTIIDEICSLKFNFFSTTLYLSLLKNMSVINIIEIYKRLYRAQLVDAQIVYGTIAELLDKGIELKHAINLLMSILDISDTVTSLYILQSIEGKIPPGEYWNVLNDLLVYTNLRKNVIENILADCINNKKYLYEVYTNLMSKLSPEEIYTLDQNLVLSFKNLCKHVNQQNQNNILSTSKQNVEKFQPIKYNIASPSSVENSNVEVTLPKMLKGFINENDLYEMNKREQLTKRNMHSIESAKEKLFLPPNIDDIPDPCSQYHDRFWKFNVDKYNLKEGLRHEDYNYVISILEKYTRNDRGESLFRRTCYEILFAEIKHSKYHLTNLMKCKAISNKRFLTHMYP